MIVASIILLANARVAQSDEYIYRAGKRQTSPFAFCRLPFAFVLVDNRGAPQSTSINKS
jgi:hypothetical protein